MKRCTRCLTKETVDTITFDDFGVCSVCRQVEFFENKLNNVIIELSTKMKSGAGIFYPPSKKHGNQAVIRLNKPLLALRSRKDLIDTLLVSTLIVMVNYIIN